MKATNQIGGISNESAYKKSLMRQLGIVTSDLMVPVSFGSVSDRLKTEIALTKSAEIDFENQFFFPFYFQEFDFKFLN